MEKDEHIPARTQFLSDSKNDNDDVQKEYEHTRLLLYEILKERGVNLDSETGKKIDDKSDIETLLRVIQNEKKEEKMSDHKLYPMYCYHQSLNRQEENPILQL